MRGMKGKGERGREDGRGWERDGEEEGRGKGEEWRGR